MQLLIDLSRGASAGLEYKTRSSGAIPPSRRRPNMLFSAPATAIC